MNCFVRRNILMPRHVSKQQQVSNLLSDLKLFINRQNVDAAIPLLEWTKDKIDLSYNESVRVRNYLSSGKQRNKPRIVKRGGIYYALLGRNVGSEQNGYRPVLVVQEKKANVTSPTVLIVPLTDAYDKNGRPKRLLGSHVFIRHPSLKKDSIIKTEYIRSISKNRLRDLVCVLDPNSQTMKDVDSCLKNILGIS